MEDRKNRILSFMRDHAYKPLKYDELAIVLDVPAEDRSSLQKILREMEAEGLIIKTRKERYGVPERMGLIVGKFQGNAKGFGFVLPDFGDEDLYIPANAINGAMHGDRVISRISRHASGDRHQEGEIINIIEHVNKTIVGKFDKSEHFGFVTPDHARLSGDIFIPKDFVNGAQKGQKVVVEITKWPEKNRNAEGRIIEILGDENEKGVDVMSIIRAYGIPYEFPEEVLHEARSLPAKVSEDEIKNRKDLRSLRMVTIDGEDARDLDDAVSIEELSDGTLRLGVHIADVTHYVKEGSHLDNEAILRGTSVYFPDRVIPMLPRELSNNICSLNAHEDRLAFSVIIDVDSTGNVVNHDIFESVIHINERMTYTDVYKILEENDAELKERYKEHVADFEKMKELALILKEKRRLRGSVDFDFDEAKIIVDENGKTIDIKRYEITIANKIIEEFMLLCNEVVSEHFYWIGIPFVYRIHEDPDPEKMESLNIILGTFGYKLKGYRDVHPKALQDVINQIKGKPEEKAINMIILRSMQKARYSDTHDWHFGLAAEYYSHFTSPIRRYPDLIIHRIMKEQINGKLDERRIEHYKEILHSIAQQSSERERAAQDAERDCEDLKKAEFMMDKLGQHFQGTISNITAFGMFVELENTIEGLVRLSAMDDDYYNYNERALCLIGERTKKTYRIGDKVTVQLVKASTEARQIDFILIDENDGDEINSIKKEPDLIKAKSTKDNERLLKHIGASPKKKKESRKSIKSKDSKYS
ncbi:MAG: ribonuclease R [Acetivibrionales bacterium]|nr:ribonuclease R [Clostridiaceae bacterium]